MHYILNASFAVNSSHRADPFKFKSTRYECAGDRRCGHHHYHLQATEFKRGRYIGVAVWSTKRRVLQPAAPEQNSGHTFVDGGASQDGILFIAGIAMSCCLIMVQQYPLINTHMEPCYLIVSLFVR